MRYSSGLIVQLPPRLTTSARRTFLLEGREPTTPRFAVEDHRR